MKTKVNQNILSCNPSLFDWDNTINLLLQCVYFTKTKDFFNNQIFKTKESLEKELNCIDYTSNQYEQLILKFHNTLNFLGQDLDLEKLIISIQKEKILRPTEINHIALMCEIVFNLAKDDKELCSKYFLEMTGKYKGKLLTKIIKPIRDIIDPNGEINYFRHPLFKKISQEIQAIEQSARIQIDSIVEKHKSKNFLAFNSFDIIHDHYVIPVKTDFYNHNFGQIIARSTTGNTFYIEPYEIAEKSIKRQELIVRREELLYKLLKEIQDELFNNIEYLRISSPIIYHFDLLLSKANSVQKYGFIRPTISNSFSLEFKNIFHPLIEDCKTNTISISSQEKGMLISGPNTGGKSVLLKSIAISLNLFRKGYFLPCESAKIPLDFQLFYFSSDLQDISKGLSSFSSEATEYLKLFNTIKSPTFLFFDEIFNSTTSDEASALAFSLFDQLINIHTVKIFASTHHHYLKVKISKQKNFLSAHTEFDEEKGIPTYRLNVGEPGSSMAIETFERIQNNLNINVPITDDAKNLINSKQLLYESLLSDLASKQGELSKELAKYRNLTKELENQKKANQGLLDLKMSKELEKFTLNLNQLNKDFNQAIDDIKTTPNINIKKQMEHFQNLKRRIPTAKNTKKTSTPQQIPISFKEGKYYFLLGLNVDVQLLSFQTSKNQGLARVNGKKITVKLSLLRKSTKLENKTFINQGQIYSSRESSLEFNARGMMLEEFIQEVEYRLSDLLSGEQPFINIIHGNGNGVLKKWLRDYLKKSSDFQWESDEANDGHTRIKIS